VATLSQSQIYTIAILTGLPNPKVMAAVAMAESSGRADVVNSIGCVGLWQINQPVHVKSHPTWTKDWLKNPINNARAAKVIYQSQGLRAWEAYTNGAYAKYLSKPVTQQPGSLPSGSSQIVNASWWGDFWDGFQKGFDTGPGPEDLVDGGTSNDPGLGDIPGLSQLGDVAEGIYGIAETMQKAGVWLSKGENWVRIAYVAGGALVVGMALFSLSTPAIRKMLGSAPQGRVLKTVSRAARASRPAAAAKAPAAAKSAPTKTTTKSAAPAAPKRKDTAV
jgi:hypothetical protein